MTDGILQGTEQLTNEQIAEIQRKWAEMWRGPMVWASIPVWLDAALIGGGQSRRKDEPDT